MVRTLTRMPSVEEVRQAIASRNIDICKLLFVGVDWYRKGGREALSVASMLNERGVKAELHVVGCNPPSPLPGYVKQYGFLSKNNREQNETLLTLFKTSTFLILPSQAEGFGIVIAEANAFGLPAVATAVGGIRTAVRNEKNGRAFEPEVFVQECSDYIMQTLSVKEQYHRLCRSSFEEYLHRLNWDSAVQSVLNVIASNDVATT